jgi:hypothetical protein
VRSLRDLPQAIEPPAGLWQRIAAAPAAVASAVPGRRGRATGALRGLAGHWQLPASNLVAGNTAAPRPAADFAGEAANPSPAGAAALPVAFDPGYLRQRAQLLAGLSARLAALPRDTRRKVLTSLTTLRQSMLDLQVALGRDPSNELLQELLVDTCQDEMRVLVSVNEAEQGTEPL